MWAWIIRIVGGVLIWIEVGALAAIGVVLVSWSFAIAVEIEMKEEEDR